MTDSPISASRNDMRHVDALPVGTRLAEFEILALLGVGGFGMVYKAFDHSLHRTVAIKEYMPATLAARTADGTLCARSSVDDPVFRAGLHSFVDEARMLAQFDHPSLVKVFRFWEAQNTAYMVMPMYHGMTLKQARTQMRSPPPEGWLRQLLWSVLSALRVLHEAGALHRDVSPDNIFLQDVGPPVLLDLGASRHAINDSDRKHTAVLKVNYAPIEQYSDGEESGSDALEQGPWSDLYSLGAVVHGCLCNDTPLPATLRALRDRMVPFSRVARTVRKQFGVDYSPSFVNAIGQALKLQPEERPQSIDAFLQLLEMPNPPAGIEIFDYRAQLGECWVEPTDQPHPTMGVTTVDLTGQPARASNLNASGTVGAMPLAATTNQALPDLVLPGPDETSAHIDFDIRADQDSADYLEPLDQVDHDGGPETVFLADERLPPRQQRERAGRAEPVTRAVQKGGSAASEPLSKAALAAPDGLNADKAVMGVPAASVGKALPSQSQRRPRTLWVLAGLAVLAVAGAAAVGMRMSAAPKAAPVATAADAAPADSQAIITELKLDHGDTVLSVPGDATSVVDPESTEPPGPTPAFVLSDDPRAASLSIASKARARRAAIAPALVPTTEILPMPEAPKPAVVPPVPVAVPAPPRAAPQRALCEDSNVLTRSSCLRAECASSDNRALQVCVAFRKAMEPLERNNFAN